jgi:hypothetical protein
MRIIDILPSFFSILYRGYCFSATHRGFEPGHALCAKIAPAVPMMESARSRFRGVKTPQQFAFGRPSIRKAVSVT